MHEWFLLVTVARMRARRQGVNELDDGLIPLGLVTMTGKWTLGTRAKASECYKTC